jgi:hypothetical protein
MTELVRKYSTYFPRDVTYLQEKFNFPKKFLAMAAFCLEIKEAGWGEASVRGSHK